jgi:hypothetical protein
MSKHEFLQGLAIFGGMVTFSYLFILSFTQPRGEFLCKATIEGRELCFHSDDGKTIRYYTKRLSLHNKQGVFSNYDDTLTDDFKVIGDEYKRFDKLKSGDLIN